MSTYSKNNFTPRPGILGVWDRVVGPGMSSRETLICLIPTLIATIYVPCFAVVKQLEWNNIQLVFSAVLAFDLFGGAIVNITPTTKRWHYRLGNDWYYHFGFVSIHIHPLLVALIYESSLVFFLIAYSYLILSTVIILFIPKHFQKAISISLYLGSILLSVNLLPAINGIEWFFPVYFLKLLVSYLPE